MMSTTSRLTVIVATALVCAALTGCSGDGDDAASPGTSAPSGSTAAAATASPTTTATTTGAVDGRFDVGGHELYMRCTGQGSPTVVYLHGYIEDDGGAESAGRVPELLADEHRVCVYDRANLGQSDAVDGLVTGEEAVADLHALLEVADIRPPYVLLGASFGGLLAYTYAATHPDQVDGMVLLDASWPGELALERFFPEEERLASLDWMTEGPEHLDQPDVYLLANRLRRPAIPVTYLLAQPSSWEGPPGYNAVVLDRIAEYVAGFSPGVLKRVRSPHYMEGAVPERVAEEVDALIARLPD